MMNITQRINEHELNYLLSVAQAAEQDHWYAGPEQREDDYGGPGGVSIGPWELEGDVDDHYEDTVAQVSGANHDPVGNGNHIATFDPLTVQRLIHNLIQARETLASVGLDD